MEHKLSAFCFDAEHRSEVNVAVLALRLDPEVPLAARHLDLVQVLES